MGAAAVFNNNAINAYSGGNWSKNVSLNALKRWCDAVIFSGHKVKFSCIVNIMSCQVVWSSDNPCGNEVNVIAFYRTICILNQVFRMKKNVTARADWNMNIVDAFISPSS